MGFSESMTLEKFMKTLKLPENVLYESGSNKKIQKKAMKENKFLLSASKTNYKEFVDSIANLADDLPKANRENAVIDSLKNCVSLSTESPVNFHKLNWYEKGEVRVSCEYRNGALWNKFGEIGTYFINVIRGDDVYMLTLTAAPFDYEERNLFFDSLSEYVYFKEGEKKNLEKGIEGVQGHYWKENETPEKLYYDLVDKKTSLPTYAKEFQIAYEKLIENILM